MLAAATVNTAVMGTASRVNEGIDWIDDQGQDAQRAALDWLRGLGTDAVDLAWDLLPDDTEMERDLDRAPCETEGGSTMGGSVVDGCVQALEDGATLEELAEPSFIEEYLQDGNSERGDEQEDDENEELRRQLEEDQFEEAMNGST